MSCHLETNKQNAVLKAVKLLLNAVALLQITLRFQCKQAYKAAGFVTNRRQEHVVAAAVIAAQQIPDSSVELVDSTGQLAYVTSMQDSSVKYEVKAAGTATASCTCAHAQLHYLCKHMMKVVGLSSGYSGAQIIQALGMRAGSSLQGFDKLQCNTVTQTDASDDQMAELEERFALTGFQSEPKPAPKRQQVSQKSMTVQLANSTWSQSTGRCLVRCQAIPSLSSTC